LERGAGRGHGTDPQAAMALEQLCRTYWYPLYAFLRREGHSPEDAQDLVQGFFLHLLQKDILRTGEKGPMSYAEAAARLGLSLSAVKSAVFRLRRRYHELVRVEVARTLAAPAEVEEELRYMLAVFSRGA
jgi:DNA-directed RNA polymerase specialized sigma24 family protein